VAFARLTVREPALSEILPADTEVLATIVDASVDSMGIAIGLLVGLQPA